MKEDLDVCSEMTSIIKQVKQWKEMQGFLAAGDHVKVAPFAHDVQYENISHFRLASGTQVRAKDAKGTNARPRQGKAMRMNCHIKAWIQLALSCDDGQVSSLNIKTNEGLYNKIWTFLVMLRTRI